MMFNLYCDTCEKGKIYPLYRGKKPCAKLWTEDLAAFTEIVNLSAASEIRDNGGQALFQLQGFKWIYKELEDSGSSRVPLLKALRNMAAGKLKDLLALRQRYSAAIITLSDKGSQGLREDTSGPEICHILKDFLPISLLENFLIPDEPGLLKALLTDLSLNQKFDLVCTSGGTGIGPRDITPQVTEDLLDLELPGFSQAMMAASLAETANAMLSRGKAGLIGRTIVINLPGSLKAVRCNLQAVLPALKHALEKAGGDTSDCGGN